MNWLSGVRSRSLMQWTFAGVVTYGLVFPVLQVALVAELPDGGYKRAGWALAATAGYVPFHLRHLVYASRGSRPPHGVWTFLLMTAIVAGAVPLVGSQWLSSFHVVAVSGLIVLRPPLSIVVFGLVVAAQAPLALILDSPQPDAAVFYPFTVLWRALSVFIPVWLLGAMWQLEAARRALAQEAVAQERLRMEDEVQRTLGTALEAIIVRGQRATRMVKEQSPKAVGELRDLVDSSRVALADARKIVHRYRVASLRSELDNGVALLTAAGIATELAVPMGSLDDVDSEHVRADLRAALERLLGDRSVRGCTIALDGSTGGLHIDVTANDSGRRYEKVTAP